jgi:hypothetical protein
VSVPKSTNGGDSWTKLADACVTTRQLVPTPGQMFLGRGIRRSWSTRRMRTTSSSARPRAFAASHVIGAGSTRASSRGRTHPDCTSQRRGQDLHRSGTATTAPVRRHDVALDPLDRAPSTRRRSTKACKAVDGARRSTSPTDFHRLRSPLPRWRNRPDDGRPHREERRDPPLPDRRDGERTGSPRPTRRVLATDNPTSPPRRSRPQAAGTTEPAGNGNPFRPPTAVRLTRKRRQPILRDGRLLHRSVLVRQRGLHTGGQARHGLRDRLIPLRRAPCNTKGVGAATVVSNGRGVLYSDTAGDPDLRTTTAPSPT